MQSSSAPCRSCERGRSGQQGFGTTALSLDSTDLLLSCVNAVARLPATHLSVPSLRRQVGPNRLHKRRFAKAFELRGYRYQIDLYAGERLILRSFPVTGIGIMTLPLPLDDKPLLIVQLSVRRGFSSFRRSKAGNVRAKNDRDSSSPISTLSDATESVAAVERIRAGGGGARRCADWSAEDRGTLVRAFVPSTAKSSTRPNTLRDFGEPTPRTCPRSLPVAVRGSPGMARGTASRRLPRRSDQEGQRHRTRTAWHGRTSLTSNELNDAGTPLVMPRDGRSGVAGLIDIRLLADDGKRVAD
jgi:hypothetical protein